MSEKASTALFIRKICHTRKVQYIIMTHYKNLTCQSAWCIITTLNVLYRRSVAKMKQGDVSLDKSGLIISIRCFLKEQSGFNVIGFFFFVVIIVLLAVIVIPNVYRFFGKQTISEQANAETSSIRVTDNSYEINPGTYPANSNALWNNPLGLNDYVARQCTFDTFTVGNGPILSAITNPNNLPANPWVGVQWDRNPDSWV